MSKVNIGYIGKISRKYMPLVTSARDELFKDTSIYSLFYRKDSAHLGMLEVANNKKLRLDFTTTTAYPSSLSSAKIKKLASSLEKGIYILDANQEKIIYSVSKEKIIDKDNFGTVPPFTKVSPVKLLIIRRDEKLCLLARSNSSIISLGFFSSRIRNYMADVKGNQTLRGTLLLVSLLVLQYPEYEKPNKAEVKHWLHLLRPYRGEYLIAEDQVDALLKIVTDDYEKEKEENSMIKEIEEILKKERRISLTSLIDIGKNPSLKYPKEVIEVDIDIPLEGELRDIIDMYFQKQILMIYTSSEKITKELVIEELGLSLTLDEIFIHQDESAQFERKLL